MPDTIWNKSAEAKTTVGQKVWVRKWLKGSDYAAIPQGITILDQQMADNLYLYWEEWRPAGEQFLNLPGAT